MRIPVSVLAMLSLGWSCWLPTHDAQADPARAPELSGCELRLQKRLKLPLSRLRGAGSVKYEPNRIREDSPISSAIAEDYSFLREGLHDDIRLLPQDFQTDCQNVASRVLAQLESFFVRRLLKLLEGDVAGRLERFYDEYHLLLAFWPKLADRQAIERRMAKAEKAALDLVLAELRTELIGTRWQSFTELPVSLETWNSEWAEILGERMPGAVLLHQNRISLQVGELDPASLKIILFHELAHLADPRINASPRESSLTRFESELEAWKQTFDFIEAHYLERLDQLPRRFTAAMKVIRRQGLEKWVKNVAESTPGPVSSPSTVQ